ncbi:MAG: UDP-glucose/GDP-mannose dehydrogenase family protein [Alphaproteobacteria bacterium]|nr:UDP-glucose/GDP-mannose dehydrogenase family protein [Alphaproteobacteria bacterium]
MRIVVVGCGYVGLVSGACLAELGHRVTCVDRDRTRIVGLREGRMPLHEPGLDALVRDQLDAGRLEFDTDPTAVSEAALVFIAVGTPARRGDGHADVSFVLHAAREIAGVVTDGTVVATKSTVPVGTGDAVEHVFHSLAPAVQVAVVSNPEFLRQGHAIEDFRTPARIVVGVEEAWADQRMREGGPSATIGGRETRSA